MATLATIPEDPLPAFSPLVDLTNPWLLAQLARGHYLANHERSMAEITGALPTWAEHSRQAEAARAAQSGEDPRPLAFVFDLDETLVSNVAAQNACRGPRGAAVYPADYFVDAAGRPWPRETPLSPPLPGAHALVAEAARHGAVVILTGRYERLRQETVDNLVAVGLAEPDGAETHAAPDRAWPHCVPVLSAADLRGPGTSLIMIPDGMSHPSGAVEPLKRAVRKRLTKAYRICAIIGDQPSDMGEEGDVPALLHNPFYRTA